MPEELHPLPPIIHLAEGVDDTQWRALFPNHEIKVWNMESMNHIIVQHELLQRLLERVEKSRWHQVVRYWALFIDGGLWVDSPYTPMQNFWHVLPGSRVSHAGPLISSPPTHPLWLKVFNILRLLRTDDVDLDLFEEVHKLPCALFMPEPMYKLLACGWIGRCSMGF